MFKVNNRNTRTRCQICSKLTIKTPERRQRRQVPLLLTLNIFHTFILVAISIFNYEQANVGYVYDHSV